MTDVPAARQVLAILRYLSRQPRPVPASAIARDLGLPRSTAYHLLRELIDAGFREKVTLRQASEAIHAHPAHLVRMFSREFGISPHQYLTGRRVDLARRLLLDGMPPSTAAVTVGFCDQSHLNRTFKRLLGTSPARFASGNVGPK